MMMKHIAGFNKVGNGSCGCIISFLTKLAIAEYDVVGYQSWQWQGMISVSDLQVF